MGSPEQRADNTGGCYHGYHAAALADSYKYSNQIPQNNRWKADGLHGLCYNISYAAVQKYLLKHTSGSGYQNDQSHGQECFRGYFVQIFFVKASALAENVK